MSLALVALLTGCGTIATIGKLEDGAGANAVAGNAVPADVQMMIAKKYSVYVEGAATLGDLVFSTQI